MFKAVITWAILCGMVYTIAELVPYLKPRATLIAISVASAATLILTLLVILF